MILDTNDSIPLYLQLKAEILNAITEHVYNFGDRIPTEPQLSEMYGVSRITVRQAVQELCEEGYLMKRQGKGTFVRQRRISRKLDNMMSFTQACKANAMVPATLVLEEHSMALNAAEAALFGETEGAQFLKTRRLRMADGIPVMLEINYFPMPGYAFLLEENLSGSLYRLLNQRGVRVYVSRDISLDVIAAHKNLAQTMNLNVGTPLFDMISKNYDRGGKLVHLSREFIVCERYHFSLEDYVVKEEEYVGL